MNNKKAHPGPYSSSHPTGHIPLQGLGRQPLFWTVLCPGRSGGRLLPQERRNIGVRGVVTGCWVRGAGSQEHRVKGGESFAQGAPAERRCTLGTRLLGPQPRVSVVRVGGAGGWGGESVLLRTPSAGQEDTFQSFPEEFFKFPSEGLLAPHQSRNNTESKKCLSSGTSLVVPQLRLQGPGQGTRSHVPQLRAK